MEPNDQPEVVIENVVQPQEAPVEVPEPVEPKTVNEANAFIQENCRVEQWERELDEDSTLYYRNVSVMMTLDNSEIILKERVLDQQIPLNVFFTKAARMMFAARQRNEALKVEGA